MADYSFRCYAYHKDKGCYVAYCLDLMLIGEGPTMQAAIADLEEAVMGYVEAVYKAGWERELIPRRARFGRWIEFYRLLLSHVLKALVTLEFSGFQTIRPDAQRVLRRHQAHGQKDQPAGEEVSRSPRIGVSQCNASPFSPSA